MPFIHFDCSSNLYKNPGFAIDMKDFDWWKHASYWWGLCDIGRRIYEKLIPSNVSVFTTLSFSINSILQLFSNTEGNSVIVWARLFQYWRPSQNWGFIVSDEFVTYWYWGHCLCQYEEWVLLKIICVVCVFKKLIISLYFYFTNMASFIFDD